MRITLVLIVQCYDHTTLSISSRSILLHCSSVKAVLVLAYGKQVPCARITPLLTLAECRHSLREAALHSSKTQVKKTYYVPGLLHPAQAT